MEPVDGIAVERFPAEQDHFAKPQIVDAAMVLLREDPIHISRIATRNYLERKAVGLLNRSRMNVGSRANEIATIYVSTLR